MNSRDAFVAQALRLRRCALDLMMHHVGGDELAAEIAATPIDAWRAFLTIEVCAIPLHKALGSAASNLDAPHRRILEDERAAGVRRILAARAQLAMLDAAAARLGLAPILLKGAVPVAEGRIAFDLGDIDLLLPTGDVEVFARTLSAAGYWPDRNGDALTTEGGLPVELHDTLHLGENVGFAVAMRSEPLAGFKALRRPGNVAHVVHLVQHGTTQHAFRRGNLRDVALTAEVLSACSHAEVDAIRAALAGTPHRELYLATLSFVDAVRSCTCTPEDCAPFERVACVNYDRWRRSRSWTDAVFPWNSPGRTYYFSSLGEWRSWTRDLMLGEVRPGSRWYYQRLGRFSPRVASVLAYLIRTPYRGAAVLYFFWSAAATRRRYNASWAPSASRRTSASA